MKESDLGETIFEDVGLEVYEDIVQETTCALEFDVTKSNYDSVRDTTSVNNL